MRWDNKSEQDDFGPFAHCAVQVNSTNANKTEMDRKALACIDRVGFLVCVTASRCQ